MENKTIYRNGIPMIFDMFLVKAIIDDELFDKYSRADLDTIVESIGYIVADLDIGSWRCAEIGVSPERYLIDAIVEYLNDGHTVYELYNLDDCSIIFEYLAQEVEMTELQKSIIRDTTEEELRNFADNTANDGWDFLANKVPGLMFSKIAENCEELPEELDRISENVVRKCSGY